MVDFGAIEISINFLQARGNIQPIYNVIQKMYTMICTNLAEIWVYHTVHDDDELVGQLCYMILIVL